MRNTAREKNLNHQQARHYLHLGRDQLISTEQVALDSHLANCADCHSYAAEMAGLQSHLAQTMRRRWQQHNPGPDINIQVQTRLRRKIWQRQLWRFTNSIGAAAATLLLVAVFGWLVWRTWSQFDMPVASTTLTVTASPQPVPPTPDEWRKPPGLTTFGDTVKLLGFSISPTSPQPDEVVQITLYWSTRPTALPYQGVIYLLDSTTNPVAQADFPLSHTPCTHSDRFSTGLFVTCYPMALVAVSPGEYQLIVGVYDPATGQKLKTLDGTDAFLLTTLEVNPLPAVTPPLVPTIAPTPTPYPIPASCPVTLPNGNPPPGQSRSLTYHGNGRLWTNLLPNGVLVPPENIRPDGKLTYNWWWWRGQRGPLSIEGRRLDDLTTPPLEAEITPGFGDSGYQDSWLIFPSEGCWEVTGKVGNSTLTFVVYVAKVDQLE